jgi:type IV pilus assembly protein PilB
MGKFNLDDLLSELGVPQSPVNDSDGERQSLPSDDPPVKPALNEQAFTSIYTPEEDESDPSASSSNIEDDLLSNGAVTAQQLTLAQTVLRQSPGHRLVDVLFEQDEVDSAAVQRLVAQRAGLPFVVLDREHMNECVDDEMMCRLTTAFAREHRVIPMRVDGKPALGAVRPDDVFILDEVRRRIGKTTLPIVVISPDDVAAALEHFGAATADELNLDEILGDIEEDDVQVIETSIDEVDLEKQAGESPVIRYVNYILQTAAKEGASDIHMEPGDKKLTVRFRIDGVLFESMQPPKSMTAAIISRLKIMANLDIAERRLPQDGRIRATIQNRRLDLRLSTLPTPHGEKCVLRILDARSINVELDDLGFDDTLYTLWKNQIYKPNGIILVTGPTGSGKTTTLYASLQKMDRQRLNISTVEDPVEYHLGGITQTQTHALIGMTFARVLKALLRQDPDVIMLGEIRDLETAQTAIQAALTGHLVLSTLHTNDAPSSITRLVNIGLEPFLVGAAVNGVLAQRLVRRLCEHCKEPDTPTEEMSEFLEMNGISSDTVFKNVGCDRCRNVGYAGRVGIYEMLVIDDQVRDVIARNPNVSEFRRLCIERGMSTLRQDGLSKVVQGTTTIEEVLRVTESNA